MGRLTKEKFTPEQLIKINEFKSSLRRQISESFPGATCIIGYNYGYILTVRHGDKVYKEMISPETIAATRLTPDEMAGFTIKQIEMAFRPHDITRQHLD